MLGIPISGKEGNGMPLDDMGIGACIALGDGYGRDNWCEVEYCECSEPCGDTERSIPGSGLMIGKWFGWCWRRLLDIWC